MTTDVGQELGIEVVPRGAGECVTRIRTATGDWSQRPGTLQEQRLFGALCTARAEAAGPEGISAAQAAREARDELTADLLRACGRIRARLVMQHHDEPAVQSAINETLIAVEGFVSGERL